MHIIPPPISQQSLVESPQIDSGLVVPVFLPSDDPIACLNKAMAFMSTDGRVTVQQVQRRQGQSFASLETKGNATSSGGNTAAGQARVVKYAYDSDCDDISSTKAVLMANLSSYGSDVLSEVQQHEIYQNDNMLNQNVQEMPYFEPSLIDYVLDNEITSDSIITSYEQYPQQTQNDKVNQETKTVNESLTVEIERYKEHVKTFEQRFNVDLNKGEKIIDSQMDDMIRDRVISRKHDVIFVVDEEETLILEEESRSKMLAKQNDPIMKKQKINTSLIDYNKLNKLAKDFGKRFVSQAIVCKRSGESKEYTKKVFKEEVITFINSLRASFKDFENGLHNELNEVKTVFNQIEAAVEQYVMNIVTRADSVLANVLLADNKCLVHDNLEIKILEQENDHLFKLLLSQDIVHICVNSLDSRNDCWEMQQIFIDEYNENLMLKAELAKKGQMLDLVPLAPKLLNDRDAHIDYIKHSREHADILHEIVEHARALRPLDSDLDSACKIVQRIQEVLVYVKDTCPSLTKPSEKLVVVTPLNKNKKVRFAEAATSSSNTKKQADSYNTQDSNKPMLPSIGMKSSTSASRSQPSGNTKNNMIL
ncbi:hypothetical protein Tco_1564059 [Tanacetum coccineum]